ncbi:MAG: glycoside hydrolase family 1 protein [Myxococcales bacterium]|nr:glycoside hydrolase family 1 protein [Myxococcales bacterium]
MRLAPLLLPLLTTSCFGCGDPGGHIDDRDHPKLKAFPSQFLWGTATASYQIEGGLHGSDWYQWESTPSNVTNAHADDGDHSYDLFDADSEAAQSIGNNTMRLGIDWSRLFPTAASFPQSPDPAAVKHYHDVFASLKKRGLQPMVTLYHWALPIWLQDLTKLTETSGWLDDGMPNKFALFAAWAGKEYGGEVDLWCTLNEPVVNLAAGYFNGVHPPRRSFGDPGGVDMAVQRAMNAARNMVLAHGKSYEALHSSDTVDSDGDGQGAEVGIAFNMPSFQAYKSDDPALQKQHDDATRRLRYISNQAFQDAVTKGNLDYDLDEKLDGPKDKIGDPSLKDHIDWMGLNYYSIVQVATLGKSSVGPITGLPRTGHLDTDHPKTEYSWDVYPEGLRESLDALRPYGKPIYITENGLADSTDAQRPRYLADHLYVLQKAIADGIDVRGYYYWSLIDNFEWQAGYCPRFGLFAIDYQDPKRTRIARPSAKSVYQKIIAEKGVDPSLFKQFPSYPEPTLNCPGGG